MMRSASPNMDANYTVISTCERVLAIPELLGEIINYLDFTDILLRARPVSTFWKTVVNSDPAILKTTFRSSIGILNEWAADLRIRYRRNNFRNTILRIELKDPPLTQTTAVLTEDGLVPTSFFYKSPDHHPTYTSPWQFIDIASLVQFFVTDPPLRTVLLLTNIHRGSVIGSGYQPPIVNEDGVTMQDVLLRVKKELENEGRIRYDRSAEFWSIPRSVAPEEKKKEMQYKLLDFVVSDHYLGRCFARLDIRQW